jgi:hypothetical protein
LAVWYDLRDDGGDARNPEHNYGLLDTNDAPKPAMAALLQLARIAGSHTFAGLVPNGPDGLHAMRLDSSADRVFVVWNDQPDASLAVQFSIADFIAATDLLGQPLRLRADKRGNAEVALLEINGPIYLSFRPR